MSDIFREIDEELRRDNLLKLWSRYGRYVIGVAILALLVAGGVVAWRDHQASERRAQATRYATALGVARDGKDAEAAKLFAALGKEGGGYSLLAAFQEAEFLAKSGDRKGAAAAYDKIAATGGIDPEFRDLAILLSVMQSLPDSDPKEAVQRLQPLTASGHPWRVSALDLTAAAKLKAGDKSGALDIYKQLADDLTAPRGLRARAAELAAALKS
ncbi:MAG TPA: tetratricopeptide repeat protein [Stellaceae bacterium]|nr:tetratricopeptide repeat protein [Stellaceae bacterium]